MIVAAASIQFIVGTNENEPGRTRPTVALIGAGIALLDWAAECETAITIGAYRNVRS